MARTEHTTKQSKKQTNIRKNEQGVNQQSPLAKRIPRLLHFVQPEELQRTDEPKAIPWPSLHYGSLPLCSKRAAQCFDNKLSLRTKHAIYRNTKWSKCIHTI